MSFASINPATGELLNTYPEHSAEEVETRLQRAWEGWQKWSRTPLSERTALLLRLADQETDAILEPLHDTLLRICHPAHAIACIRVSYLAYEQTISYTSNLYK